MVWPTPDVPMDSGEGQQLVQQTLILLAVSPIHHLIGQLKTMSPRCMAGSAFLTFINHSRGSSGRAFHLAHGYAAGVAHRDAAKSRSPPSRQLADSKARCHGLRARARQIET